jgi:hypothetical protein
VLPPHLQILATKKYLLGYHRSSSFWTKLNIDLSPPISMPLFLKSLWVRFYFFSLSFSKFMLQKSSYYYLFIWFQIMLLWILPEVEDQGARMSIGQWTPANWTVNTKVDMRFNVENAYWLSERVREKIMQMVCVS